MNALPLGSEASCASEARFDVAELFFSRTNPAGVIVSGNHVFRRVSGYAWDELVGAPHKIIRHRDMPRAVFWALWRTIQAGEPIGAYVKNRAKSGAFYWVFAIVSPIDDGYLSVRLKPTSDMLAVVRGAYEAAVEAESTEQLSPEASMARLGTALAALGFEDYGAFMAEALSREVAARDRRLGRTADTVIALFERLGEAAAALLKHANTIAETYQQYEYMPLNFQIQAAQLGQQGASVGAISANYTAISAELSGAVRRFIDSARGVVGAINNGRFLACVARVQREMAELFRTEDASTSVGAGFRADEEVVRLEAQQRAYTARAADSLRAIGLQAEAFRADCAEMNYLSAGLQVTRILGKVECARLVDRHESFAELLHQLGEFQRCVAVELRELDRRNLQIQADSGRLLAAARTGAGVRETA